LNPTREFQKGCIGIVRRKNAIEKIFGTMGVELSSLPEKKNWGGARITGMGGKKETSHGAPVEVNKRGENGDETMLKKLIRRTKKKSNRCVEV